MYSAGKDSQRPFFFQYWIRTKQQMVSSRSLRKDRARSSPLSRAGPDSKTVPPLPLEKHPRDLSNRSGDRCRDRTGHDQGSHQGLGHLFARHHLRQPPHAALAKIDHVVCGKGLLAKSTARLTQRPLGRSLARPIFGDFDGPFPPPRDGKGAGVLNLPSTRGRSALLFGTALYRKSIVSSVRFCRDFGPLPTRSSCAALVERPSIVPLRRSRDFRLASSAQTRQNLRA